MSIVIIYIGTYYLLEVGKYYVHTESLLTCTTPFVPKIHTNRTPETQNPKQ